MNSNTKKRRIKTFGASLPRSKPNGILHSSFRGYLFSLGIGALLTIVLSALVYSLSDPNRYITPVSFCILYISALLSGFLSSRFNRGSALLCGTLSSLMLLITMFLISLFFGGSFSADYSISLAVGLRGIAVALSIVGAMIGSHKSPTKRKRK